MVSGRIFNVQNYSIHDGPGIRTAVFLKGCSLACWWCHNPESIAEEKEYLYHPSRCIECGLCREDPGDCPTGAREMVGTDMTPAEVLAEIEKDRIFYQESAGGVTFSGGEPLLQLEFLKEILRLCQEKDISTAVDTSGSCSWEALAEILEQVDLFLYDLKFIDSQKHKKYTGVDNSLLLDNLKELMEQGARVEVRFPLVPGINDSREDLLLLADRLKELDHSRLTVLPYHRTGIDKYRKLDREYRLAGLNEPDLSYLEEKLEILRGEGITVKIEG